MTLEGRVREYLEEEASFLPLPLYPHPTILDHIEEKQRMRQEDVRSRIYMREQ